MVRRSIPDSAVSNTKPFDIYEGHDLVGNSFSIVNTQIELNKSLNFQSDDYISNAEPDLTEQLYKQQTCTTVNTTNTVSDQSTAASEVSLSSIKENLANKNICLRKGFNSKYLQPPPLPTIHVNRQDLLNKIATKLLQASINCNALETTLTIIGLGGFGKTTIVTSLCYHCAVKEHFTDGFIFIELGQQAMDPGIKLRALYNLLTDEWCDINVVEQKIKQLTKDYYRSLLVIIDDVWHVEDAEPLVKAFSNCKTILTTRMNDIEHYIPSKQSVSVGPMRQNEAVLLLSSGVFDSSQLSQEDVRLLVELAQDVHLWPLLLSLIRGQLSHNAKIRNFSKRKAIENVKAKLNHEGLRAMDKYKYDTEAIKKSRNFAVEVCIKMTLELLTKPFSDRIKKLILWTGIGTSLQVAVLKNLWNVSQQEAKDTVDKVWGYGLVQFTDFTISTNNITQHCVEVHPVISQCIIDSMNSSEAYGLSPVIGKMNIIESVSKELATTFQLSCGIHDLSSLTAIDNLNYLLMEIENVVFPFNLKQVNLYMVNDPHSVILKLKEIKNALIRLPYLSKLDVEIDSLMKDCKQILNNAHKLCRKLNQSVQKNLYEKNFQQLIQTVEQFIKNYPLCVVAQKAVTMVENRIKPYCDGELLNLITIRCEALKLMGPDYHEITVFLIPEIKLFIKLHNQITTSLQKGSPAVEQTNNYLRSGKFKKEYMKLRDDGSMKIQKVASNFVYLE